MKPIAGFKEGRSLAAGGEWQRSLINVMTVEEGVSLQKGTQPSSLSLDFGSLRCRSDFGPAELSANTFFLP